MELPIYFNRRTGMWLPQRWRLTDNPTTFWINSVAGTIDPLITGLDQNFPISFTEAVRRLHQDIDQAGCSVILRFIDGTYGALPQIAGDWVGHHNVEIWGNPLNKTLVTISAGAGERALYVSDKARIIVRHLNFDGDPLANHIAVEQFAIVGIDTCRFNNANTAINANIQGQVKTNGPITLEGNMGQIFQAIQGGIIEIGSSAHQVPTAMANTYFAVASIDGLIATDPGASFAGAGVAGTTGQRFLSQLGSGITSGGAGVNFFPGNVAGTTDATSFYQ